MPLHCALYFIIIVFLNSGYEKYCDDSDFDDTSPDWKGPGWYRLTGEAGTRIPEKTPDSSHCGSQYSGWMDGVHPTTPGEQAVATICFDQGFDDCYDPVSITVINCGDFFLYELPTAPWCYYRYCGSLV